MSDKTQTMAAKFYLVSSRQSLCITHLMTLGRTQGDFTFNDPKLSSLHCEFIPRHLNLFVKDLNSTNGVYVNKQKIFPNSETKLETGDHLVIGSFEFVVFDNEESAKAAEGLNEKAHSQVKKVPRHASLFSLRVSKLWGTVYTLMVFATLASFIVNLQLDLPVPKELESLGSLYADLIMNTGIQSVFLIIFLCLGHAVAMRLMIKSRFYRLVLSGALGLSFFFMINLSLGPLWYVKKYILSRDVVLKKDERNLTAILKMRELIQAESDLIDSFKYIEKKINDKQKEALVKDLMKLQKEIKVKKAHIAS